MTTATADEVFSPHPLNPLYFAKPYALGIIPHPCQFEGGYDDYRGGGGSRYAPEDPPSPSHTYNSKGPISNTLSSFNPAEEAARSPLTHKFRDSSPPSPQHFPSLKKADFLTLLSVPLKNAFVPLLSLLKNAYTPW